MVPFETRQLFIGGRWRDAAGGRTLDLANPSDGSVLAHIARGGADDIDAAVRAARAALDGPWGRMTATERGRVLAEMGRLVLTQADPLARLEAIDVGKPLKQGRADAVALARYLEFYGGAADKVHGQTLPYQAGFTALTWREPHGVTGHIVPWNYPMQIVGRSVGAALAMGNACVLKPAEEACLTVLAFARIAEAAGLPAGALNVVPGLGEEAGAALSAHEGVDHVSFTGSVATARWCRRPLQSTRSPSRWSWAARARRSSLPTRTSTRRFRSWSTPASRTRGRRAPRHRASSSSDPSTTQSRPAWPSAIAP
jgi:aldehyde dehydrogenase (NAD+)